jgi:hypothetical protein
MHAGAEHAAARLHLETHATISRAFKTLVFYHRSILTRSLLPDLDALKLVGAYIHFCVLHLFTFHWVASANHNILNRHPNYLTCPVTLCH